MLAIVGISYLSFSIIVSQNPARYKNIFRQYIARSKNAFQSELMQTVLKNAGWNIEAHKVNIFRAMTSTGFLIVTYGSMFLKDQPLEFWPLIYSCIFIFCTSPAPFTPSGWVLRKIHEKNTIRKDGELIAFIKLYENNRMKESGYVSFESFCSHIAPHFEYIGKDLAHLSVRVTEDGLEKALDWFCSLFPRDHPFIHDIRSIILTVENMDDYETVARHLKSQSAIIAKLSSDQYERRWSFISDIATIFTSIPSILIFLMVISLVLLYVTIVKDNFNSIPIIS